MRISLLPLTALLLTSCAHHGRLACRLVALRPDGSIITHGSAKPAPWHQGEDQCMLKLRVMESLPDEIRESIGVQFRGPADEVKSLHKRWDAEHVQNDAPDGTKI